MPLFSRTPRRPVRCHIRAPTSLARTALCVSAQTRRRQTRILDARARYVFNWAQQRAAAPNEPALDERPSFHTLEGQNTMLCQTKDLQDRAIVGSDGAIGGIRDFYFDGEA